MENLKNAAMSRIVLVVATAVATAVGTQLAVAFPTVYQAICGIG